jgi:hypothetical protein
MPGMPLDTRIDETFLKFSSNGQRVFFQFKKTQNSSNQETSSLKAENLHVSSSFDKILQLTTKPTDAPIYLATSTIYKPSITLLSQDSTEIDKGFGNDQRNHYLIRKNKINPDEFYWNGQIQQIELVSLENGKSKLVTKFNALLNRPTTLLSPNEKFVIWFDERKKCYYSYNTKTGDIVNISKKIPFPVYESDNEFTSRQMPYLPGGWTALDEGILLYDRFDIWKVDPRGKREAVNLTRGYGRKNKIIFRAVGSTDCNQLAPDTLILSAFRIDNKDNGLGRLTLKGELLFGTASMGAYVYSGNSSVSSWSTTFNYAPQPVGRSSYYIVRRMNASISPNLFLTRDFSRYDQLTAINPEGSYNWLNTSLIKWKLPDGHTGEGILYRPENLDSTKKYPVIFHYYEKKSDELNVFLYPELSEGGLDIPWFVSNGYLVFVPDMYYKAGKTREMIGQNILSAIKSLKDVRWVDTANMALQGHSYGGYETLAIIQKTNSFKAAQESAGVSNWISQHGHVFGSTSRQLFTEFGQPNMGAAPWISPQVYIENSPIFYASAVNTPLMILHNAGDENVTVEQGIEMFTALRRLQKPCWLLNYEAESHTIGEEENKLDFSIKQQQFFNHFLKGEKMPLWMYSR